jgi:acetone carboxylase gamma subunit
MLDQMNIYLKLCQIKVEENMAILSPVGNHIFQLSV